MFMSERMCVPKCKECKFYEIVAIRDYSNDSERWCNLIALLPKFIKGGEARTSPKWCPKRLRESE